MIVREIVCRCLGRGIDGVEPQSRLFADLGADSLDVIDIIYQIERTTGTPLDGPERSFLAALNSIPPDALIDEKTVRSSWLDPWREAFPGLESLLDAQSVTREQLKDLITIRALVTLVESKRPSEG